MVNPAPGLYVYQTSVDAFASLRVLDLRRFPLPLALEKVGCALLRQLIFELGIEPDCHCAAYGHSSFSKHACF